MDPKFKIGCSGYYYPTWKNNFYPKGLQSKNWLEFYSSVFNTVELNGTFYRQPKPSDLKKYFDRTPQDFKFSVKMSRYITHVQRLKDSRQSVAAFQDLILHGLGAKLEHFLFQMPPTFLFTEENLALVLSGIPNNANNVVEFRHGSWWNAEVKNALTAAGITFCNVDYPGMDSYFIQSSSKFYLRLHGSPDLFKSSYSGESLKKFYGDMPMACDTYSVYFNNTYFEAGYKNAVSFKHLTNSVCQKVHLY